MRKKLRDARMAAGLTQQQVAERVKIGLRYYKQIEAGNRTGDFRIWDALEDLFNIHQRQLREISESHPDTGDNR